MVFREWFFSRKKLLQWPEYLEQKKNLLFSDWIISRNTIISELVNLPNVFSVSIYPRMNIIFPGLKNQ